jgi:hypothetical protein
MADKEHYIARATNIAARMIAGEMMIMSGLDSSLYSLNATASVLWQAADGVTPLADIVEHGICTRSTSTRRPLCAMPQELAGDLARHRHSSRIRHAIVEDDRSCRRKRREQSDARNGRQGVEAWDPAQRPARPHLSLQRALRAIAISTTTITAR